MKPAAPVDKEAFEAKVKEYKEQLKTIKPYTITKTDDLVTIDILDDRFEINKIKKEVSYTYKPRTKYAYSNQATALFSDWCSLYADKFRHFLDIKHYDIDRKAWAKAANTVYGRPIRDIKKIVCKAIWNELDKELITIVCRALGIQASFSDYNIAWQHKDKIVELSQKTPGLLPLFFIAYKRLALTDEGAFKLLLENPIQYFKLQQSTLSNGEWKYLINASPRLTAKLGDEISFAHYIKLFTQVGEINFMMALRMLHRYEIYDLRYVPVLKAAQKVIKKHRQKKYFLSTEFDLVIDWLRMNEETAFNHPYFTKADWAWYMKKQQEWHDETGRGRGIRHNNFTWNSSIEEFKFKGCSVVPLISSEMLRQEGRKMHHCVAGYDRYCKDGNCEIFSIRKANKSLATFEVRKKMLRPEIHFPTASEPQYPQKISNQYCWELQQLRGPCNNPVNEMLTIIANETLSKLNEKEKLLVTHENLF
jgi:hypothetical protein